MTPSVLHNDIALSAFQAARGAEMGAEWLNRFYAGNRAVLEEVYREHFGVVERAVARVLAGADKETVVHEVFYNLLSNEEMRRHFRGGSLDAWLSTVARHRAIDFRRRFAREHGDDRLESMPDGNDEGNITRRADARRLLERFHRDWLPEKWTNVFRARFVYQLSQREAAEQLGIHRTTLAYQEIQIRRLLRRFFESTRDA